MQMLSMGGIVGRRREFLRSFLMVLVGVMVNHMALVFICLLLVFSLMGMFFLLFLSTNDSLLNGNQYRDYICFAVLVNH
jgi:hypothetical protein